MPPDRQASEKRRDPRWRRAWTLTVALGALIGAGSMSGASPAQGAEAPTGTARIQMLKAVAASHDGQAVGFRVRGAGATMQPLWPDPTVARTNLVVVRSSIDARWGAVVATPLGWRAILDQQKTFLMRRTARGWRAVASTERNGTAAMLCRRAGPATDVALDLGLVNGWSAPKPCRYPRLRRALERPMSRGEINSVRAMVETRWVDGEPLPAPVRVNPTDAPEAICDWEPDAFSQNGKPSGTIARANPRWGVVRVGCAVAVDSYSGNNVYDTTHLLVAPAGTSGAFTRVVGHTIVPWSPRRHLCTTDRRWPVPARVRVALEFCTPFPDALHRALGTP